jgi:hypothetical protein
MFYKIHKSPQIMCETLSNHLLRKNRNKYSIELLEKNMMNVNIKVILMTQILTPEFCVKYILSHQYALDDNETYIIEEQILQYQPHISLEDLENAEINYMLSCA